MCVKNVGKRKRYLQLLGHGGIAKEEAQGAEHILARGRKGLGLGQVGGRSGHDARGAFVAGVWVVLESGKGEALR